MSLSGPFVADSVSFIGAGRLGTTLAVALSRIGLNVVAIASRDAAKAERLAARLAGCRAVLAQEAARADLVFVTVSDDAIGPVAQSLSWRAGQAVVHCSGATEVGALEPAARQGALTGGFHPLQNFADPERALALLAGSAVAIEAPPALAALLRQHAERLGMQALALPAGARALYHGGASYAASFLLSMLQEAAAIWESFGIQEAEALEALLPVALGSLQAAAGKGLVGGLAGPISRGDAGVVERHLRALERLGPGHAAFYREFSRRQLELARRGGRLTDAQLARLHALVAP